MAAAAPRIAIDFIDQLADVVKAIAVDMGRLAPRGGNHRVADHEHAIVVARDKPFHQHFVAALARRRVRRGDLFRGFNIDGDALALITKARFDHHAIADLARGSHGILGADYRAPTRHRNSRGSEDRFGQFFVLGQGLGNDAGAIGVRRLNAALAGAPAELHEAALG